MFLYGLFFLHLKPNTGRIKRPGRPAAVWTPCWLIWQKFCLFSSAEIVLLDLFEVELLTPPLL